MSLLEVTENTNRFIFLSHPTLLCGFSPRKNWLHVVLASSLTWKKDCAVCFLVYLL